MSEGGVLIIPCPRCHQQCGWCSDYRHMHRQLTLPGTNRRCGVRGFEPEGKNCPVCKGSMKVRATTTYQAINTTQTALENASYAFAATLKEQG